jgi:glutathione peroxidase
VLGTKSIKWNFTKFLISRDGVVVARFGSLTVPKSLNQAISRLL